MICPTCGKITAATRTYFRDNQTITVCPDENCGNFKPSKTPPHMTSVHKQKIQWQRDKYGADLEQPFEIRKGETHKGWQPNKSFLKVHADHPEVLGGYSEQELQKTGMVTEENIKKSRKFTPKKKV